MGVAGPPLMIYVSQGRVSAADNSQYARGENHKQGLTL